MLERAEPAATGGQFTRVNDLAAEVGQPTLRWVALFTQAMWAMFRGSAERSEELALAALDLGTGTGQPDTMAVFGVQLVGVRWHQGRMGELVELVADVARANPGLHGYRAVHAHRRGARPFSPGLGVRGARRGIDPGARHATPRFQ